MRFNLFITGLLLAVTAQAQTVSLDSCRSMALHNNKQLMMARQRITTAKYHSNEAFAAYLPGIDFVGGYLYNQKDISIFDKDQMLPTKTFNILTQQYEFNLVKNPLTGEPIKGPNGQYVPETIALIPKEAMKYDIHNVFAGAVTLTQPIFMGGKIVALNKITHFAEDLAKTMHNQEAENVVYAVDAAYWQVVSLKAKHDLAVSYVNLLDSLDRNVKLMVEQGVATRSDLLNVDVKLNSAQIDLVKVENGLALSRMALAQVCGLPVNEVLILDDENLDNIPTAIDDRPIDMADVYDRRNDIRALQLGINIAQQKKNIEMASMLPNLALVGTYSFSNPNMFDGFKKRFDGMFSVGAMLTIPIWHWGGNYYKYKAADSEVTTMKMQLSDAKELIELQVSQASFRAQEAVKTYAMSKKNLDAADENLRTATLAFHEGVATADDVMAAQTAWLMANSEQIDARIDVSLCATYLARALGTLSY